MAIDLAAIRKKLNQISGQNSRKNSMWRPEEGSETTVRLMFYLGDVFCSSASRD